MSTATVYSDMDSSQTKPSAEHGAKKSKLKLAYHIVKGVLEAVIFLVVGSFLVGLLVFHLQPMTMVTGSMQKTIPVGSLVVDKSVPAKDLKVGDVITFQKPIGAKGLDSHRIIKIQRSNGHTVYRTKGDSNPIVDPWAISFKPTDQAHKMLFSIPYAGQALLFTRSPLGRLLFIGFVSLMLLMTILKAIAAAATKHSAEKDQAEAEDNNWPSRLSS